jgi:hypothetical protein
MNNAQHSADSVRWGTPYEWIEREREVFNGPIHFDPCSEAEFNATVGAALYFSLEERGEDGLKLPWPTFSNIMTVHLNPPGGLIREFWDKVLVEPSVQQCMWYGFAMNQLNLLADKEVHPTDFSIVYLRKRIPFNPHSTAKCKKCSGTGVTIHFSGVLLNEDHAENSQCKSCRGTGKVQGDRPSQANYLCGMGVDPSRFERVYKDLGAVRHGRLAK